MKKVAVRVILIALSAWVAWAQAVPDLPEFEVASVKLSGKSRPMRPGVVAEVMACKGGPGTQDPGRITCSGVSLETLLMLAYRVKQNQIFGPDWLDSTPYDIVAKLPPDTDSERLRLMWQRLLVERFRITFHWKTEKLPIYNLTVDRNGPKLRSATAGPKTELTEAENNALKERTAALAAAPRGADYRRASIKVTHITTARFAAILSLRLDRPVRDGTGLDGFYDFTLSWVPDAPSLIHGRSINLGELPPGPNLFAALRQQLGLRLEPGKGPVELLVIASVEQMPTSN